MGMAKILHKKDFIESKSVCVATSWTRIAMTTTPECSLVRKFMLERLDHDPLSQKQTVIYKAKGRIIAKNRDNNPVLISIYTYPHSLTKTQLEEIHGKVVQAVTAGEIRVDDENFLDLRDYLEVLYANYKTRGSS